MLDLFIVTIWYNAVLFYTDNPCRVNHTIALRIGLAIFVERSLFKKHFLKIFSVTNHSYFSPFEFSSRSPPTILTDVHIYCYTYFPMFSKIQPNLSRLITKTECVKCAVRAVWPFHMFVWHIRQPVAETASSNATLSLLISFLCKCLKLSCV